MAEAVFLSNRRTPEIVSDGAKSKKAGGKAGHVVSRRKLNAKEEKQRKKGKWIRVRKDGKKPGDSGYLSGPSKGPDANRKNLSESDDERDILIEAARALSVHGDKYSAEERELIKSRIRGAAQSLGVSINLANDDQATDFGNNKTGAGNNNDGKKSQAGKTRAQPRAFGGKFGKKGATNGEQAMPGENPEPPGPDPETFVATVNNLQIGQSVALPNNEAKVKRLGNGYQLVKMDGSINKVVKTLPEATAWTRKMAAIHANKGVPASNDSNQPANR